MISLPVAALGPHSDGFALRHALIGAPAPRRIPGVNGGIRRSIEAARDRLAGIIPVRHSRHAFHANSAIHAAMLALGAREC